MGIKSNWYNLNEIMFSFVYRELIMSDAQTTIILSAFAVVLILYVIKQERKSGVFALGQKKPRAILGSQKNKNRPSVIPVDPTKRPARFDDFTKEDFLGNPLARDLKDGFAKEDFLGGISIKDSGLEKSFLGGVSIKDSGLEKSFLGGAKIKDTVLEEKFLGASTLADLLLLTPSLESAETVLKLFVSRLRLMKTR